MTCPNCSGNIEPGTLHCCHGPSLQVPWLQSMLEAVNKPVLDELGRIRQLLEDGNKPPVIAKPQTKAQTRETR